MKQINNNFKDYYYLKEDGTVFNNAINKLIKADNKHFFYLKTKDNSNKKIALKTLYKIVYGLNYCNDTIEDLENEIWKDISGTNGLYKISNLSRIKSLQGYEAVILKPFKNQSGYERVDIVIDGIRQSKLVHRLVAAAFLPMPESIDMVIHHKDFNKNNSAAANLIWLTAAEHSKIHNSIKEKKVEERKTETTSS